MSDAINRALAAAAEEAGDDTATTTTSTSVAAMPQGGAVVEQTASRSLDDLMATAAMHVECFLKVSEVGIFLGKDKKPHDTLDVEMCFGNAKAGYSLRVNTGGGVRYLTSYDGRSEARSRENWQKLIEEAKKVDPKSYVSDLIELPVKLLNDTPRKEGSPLPAGTVVGLSLNYQAGKAFTGWLKEQYPKFGKDKTFNVRISAIPKVGSGQDYGIYGFEVIEDAAPAKGKSKAA